MSADKLRDEILANQASRRDLLKWKIILASGATALGLGFTGSKTPYSHLALCAVPFVAAYCDLLIRDHDLRIATKGYFLLKHTDDLYAQYENFIKTGPIAKTKWWAFSHAAVFWTSLFMCMFVGAVGVCYLATEQDPANLSWLALFAAAVVGGIMIVYIQRAYRKKQRAIRDASVA